MTPGGRFATTRWTMVNAAGHRSDPRASAALGELCQIYWPPLYSYLRGRGYSTEEAQDLTQGFFARLLERQDIQAADPARGRFRGFLLTALKRDPNHAPSHTALAVIYHELGNPVLATRHRALASKGNGSR